MFSLFHHILGGMLIIIYFLAFILSFFHEKFSKSVRMVGDILLFFQYIVGIGLLIMGLRNTHLHYAIALLPIILLPFSKKLGNRLTIFLFLVIILITYITGMRIGL
ncbi:MAG: hypothetical protein N2504_05965 [candidate division WOR-3 bacterium]|nr:hypothetical protein [candidate division WOR-3 bacterium]